MARISALVIAVTVFFGVLPVMAAQDGDVRTCALTRGIECITDEGCVEWTMQEMALPRFVRIDLKAKTITSLDKDLPRTTQINSLDRLEGAIVLHGTEMRGWSITLGEDSGELTLAASGDGEGFIVFGSCMIP